MEDVKLTLTKSDFLDDWYIIERAEHDGRQWLEPTGRNSASLMCSSRISDADIEGPADEMRAIASAIRERKNARFTRCAVKIYDELASFCSPRNSQESGTVPYARALELAGEIERLLGAPIDIGRMSAIVVKP